MKITETTEGSRYYIAPLDINHDVNPFCGLGCEVIARFGSMSHAGFDCIIAFTDEAAFVERLALAGLITGAGGPEDRTLYDAADQCYDAELVARAAGRPVMEAHEAGQIVAYCPTCHACGRNLSLRDCANYLREGGCGLPEVCEHCAEEGC